MRTLPILLLSVLLVAPCASAQTLEDMIRWQAEKDAPETPKSPSPASASTGAPLPVTLAWKSAGATNGYDVYFGTSSSPAKVGSVTAPSYQPPALAATTKYYWKIVAKNPKGTMTGPVWNFTTAAAVPPPPQPPPPPPPPSTTGTPSVDGTRVPPAPQIIDTGGHVWTFSGTQTLQDGVWVSAGMGTQYAWCGGVLSVFGTDSAWYRWTGTVWSRTGAADPCPTAPPPLDPPPPVTPTGLTFLVAFDPPPQPAAPSGYRLTLDGTLTADISCCLGGFANVPSGAHTVTVRALYADGSVSAAVPQPPLPVTVP